MGDIKKLKKRYSAPRHPWNKSVIEAESKLKREYGLQRKKEIYVADSFLKKYKDIAKRLIADNSKQGEKEKQAMMDKLQRIGLLSAGAKLDDVLSLELKDVLERRMQSLACRKGMARSMKQARQFITHRHLVLGNKEITSPSYIVSLEEEGSMSFKPSSSLQDEEHPERVVLGQKEVMIEKPAEKEEKVSKEKTAAPKKAKKEKRAPPEKNKPGEEAKETVKEEGKSSEQLEEAKEDIPSAEELTEATKEKFAEEGKTE